MNAGLGIVLVLGVVARNTRGLRFRLAKRAVLRTLGRASRKRAQA